MFLQGSQIPTKQLLVEPSMTVLALKKEIFEREGVPVDKQRLLFMGKQLANRETLAHYGIKEDSTL